MADINSEQVAGLLRNPQFDSGRIAAIIQSFRPTDPATQGVSSTREVTSAGSALDRAQRI
jgi:hypothetical protein